jgi:hypothetical protein
MTMPLDPARDPITRMTEALRQYFDTHRVVPVHDPWTRILDGFLVRVHITMWPGKVRLHADDFGLDAEAYAELNGKVRWGTLDLRPDDIGPVFDSLATRARALPHTWGVRVHWGLFVPHTAIDRFRAAWQELEAQWHAAVETWVEHYDACRAIAVNRAAIFARQAWNVAHRVKGDRLNATQYAQQDAFVDRLVPRLLADYPTPDEIRRRFTMQYELAFIPTPTLQAEQAAYVAELTEAHLHRLEAMRREAELRAAEDELRKARLLAEIDAERMKQQEKLRIVQAFAEETTRKLRDEQQRLLAEFYRGYAVEIRQRLHESLMLLIEGVRAGRIKPQATRSLRLVLDELRHLALDDDAEIQQMRERLQTLIGNAGDPIDAQQIRRTIEDFGVLLQTEILALGETPRLPQRMTAPPIDVTDLLPTHPNDMRSMIRSRQRRCGIDQSLAATLIDAGLLPTTRRPRADRFTDLFAEPADDRHAAHSVGD